MTTMNTPKHTPLNKAVHAIPMLYAEAFAGSNNKEFVVELYNDARLLEKAAPAMYEALKDLLQQVEARLDARGIHDLYIVAIKAKAALAQADGEGILP